MSLFVAIRPSESASEDLRDAIDRVHRPLEPLRLHWQPADRWHVTMAFLGDQDDDADDVVSECIDAVAAAAAPVSLRLGGAGCFGRQVLWIGVQGAGDADDAAFADLGRAVHSGVRRHGFPLERWPWRPHLTIARTRGTDARPAVAHLTGYQGPGWPIEELLVVRSEGGPHPRHTVVHSAAISPRADGLGG